MVTSWRLLMSIETSASSLERERFPDDQEANGMLQREQRTGFEII